jgi:hypothetical protein
VPPPVLEVRLDALRFPSLQLVRGHDRAPALMLLGDRFDVAPPLAVVIPEPVEQLGGPDAVSGTYKDAYGRKHHPRMVKRPPACVEHTFPRGLGDEIAAGLEVCVVDRVR